MSFLNFIKKNDGIRTTSDCFSEFSSFPIADIAGRGSDDLGYGMTLHEFAHIETDKSLLVAEEALGENLGKMSFPDTGWAKEKKRANRAFGIAYG